MKRLLLVALLVPRICLAQKKTKKQKAAEEKANMALVASLKAHIQYLADDKLEGRRTGSHGELLAMQYISDQYKQMGLQPAGTNGYVQEFDIDEGKQAEPALTFFKLNGKDMVNGDDFIPLAFSATKTLKG